MECALYGDVCFDRVEESLDVPENADGVCTGAYGSFGDGVPFVCSPVKVAPFDGSVSFVGGLPVVPQEYGVNESSHDTQRRGEDPYGTFAPRVFFRHGSDIRKKCLERRDEGELV